MNTAKPITLLCVTTRPKPQWVEDLRSARHSTFQWEVGEMCGDVYDPIYERLDELIEWLDGLTLKKKRKSPTKKRRRR